MQGISSVDILKKGIDSIRNEKDLLVREEPLEIRIGLGEEGKREQFSISVTMRTPGNDDELAIGFLYSEGIIKGMEDVLSVHYCTDIKKPEEEGNVIRVELNPGLEVDAKLLSRHFYTTSSCGVCGKSSLEAVSQQCQVKISPLELSNELVLRLPEILRSNQLLFKYTGGIHAAGLFTSKGELLGVMEDIGRHNAVDKLIGASLLKNEIPWKDKILVVSGRAGFELVQKAIVAGVSAFVSVGAPSSLSHDLAQEHGMKLYGFVKKDEFNQYV